MINEINKVTEKEILSYYLNLNCETIKESNSQIETISFQKKLNGITLNFKIISLQTRYNGQEFTLQVVFPELENKILTIFEIEFYNNKIDFTYIMKYLFFAVKGMKIFLNNYDSIKMKVKSENKNLIVSSIENRTYSDNQIFQKDIIINNNFNLYNNIDEKAENKILINKDNINSFYFNHTYPRTGRLNLCQSYKGTNIDITNLEIFQIINLKTIRGTIKEFLVINLNKEENTAIIIENNKKYKLNEVIISDNDLIYLASESSLESSYDALFMENRLLCKNWKNSRLLTL